MKLYVNGREISELVLADLAEQPVQLSVRPEGYLEALNTFLVQRGKSPEDIEAIYAVIGEGSATALRTSLAIVNTIRFVRKIPLYGIQAEITESDEEIVRRIESEAMEESRMLTPFYAQAPKVTTSKKDELGRLKE